VRLFSSWLDSLLEQGCARVARTPCDGTTLAALLANSLQSRRAGLFVRALVSQRSLARSHNDSLAG
jgi:hypothetical protein